MVASICTDYNILIIIKINIFPEALTWLNHPNGLCTKKNISSLISCVRYILYLYNAILKFVQYNTQIQFCWCTYFLGEKPFYLKNAKESVLGWCIIKLLLKSHLFIHLLCVCAWVWMCVCMPGGQWITRGSHFSSSTLWFSWFELRSSYLLKTPLHAEPSHQPPKSLNLLSKTTGHSNPGFSSFEDKGSIKTNTGRKWRSRVMGQNHSRMLRNAKQPPSLHK